MSRYPQMSQPATTYDRSLLVGAPAVTQADRQAGYDINALEQGSYYASPSSRPPVAPSAPAPVPINPFADQNYALQPSPEPSIIPPKKPWYKTTKGRAIIGLAVIIFIGLIAGIAAGTASAKQSKNTTLLSDNTNTQLPAAQVTDNSPTTPIATTTPSSSPENTNNSNPNVVTSPQQPATLTFGSGNGNGNGNGNGATRSTPGSNQGATTILFGGTTQPAIIAPTQGSGSGNTGNDGGDIPAYCYVFPYLSDCSGYFDNVPKH